VGKKQVVAHTFVIIPNALKKPGNNVRWSARLKKKSPSSYGWRLKDILKDTISMNEPNDAQQKKIAGYLGIAQKAGRIVAGDNMVKDALEKNKVELLVVANDVSLEVKAGLTRRAKEKEIDILNWPNKIDLGLIVGKSRRGAVAVLDRGFAEAIKKVMEF
jgi:ribosomal protein L7Ae-like RNA K-turn-binding protein